MKALILCYHKVGPVSSEGRWLNIEPTRLANHVDFFARRQWRFSTASGLAQGEWGKVVCLTFDDAYLSAMENAPAILEARKAVGTFYAVPNLVGKTSSWDGDRARPLADWDLLKAAQAAGHEIGNHTLTHPHLAHLNKAEQAFEIGSALTELRARGFQTQSVCFPYGDYNDSTLEVLAESGIKIGLKLGKRVATTADNRLALPRIIVAYSDSLPKLLYKVHIRPLLKKT